MKLFYHSSFVDYIFCNPINYRTEIRETLRIDYNSFQFGEGIHFDKRTLNICNDYLTVISPAT